MEASHPEIEVVHVEVVHTGSAREKQFPMASDASVQQTVDEAYEKLKESRQAGDLYMAMHDGKSTDLKPYLKATLASLLERGIGVFMENPGRAVLNLEIQPDSGGA